MIIDQNRIFAVLIIKLNVFLCISSVSVMQSANGMYTGFIKVQMDLRRPITVKGGGAGGLKGQEAFYLPRGSINTLHISSTNTVRQVIEALLKKFTVADNPAKFALFKRFSREDQGETRSMNVESASAYVCVQYTSTSVVMTQDP